MEYTNPLAQYIQGPQQQTLQQQQAMRQQAIIEALRNMGGAQQQGAPAQVGNVTSTNGGQGGMQSGLALGDALGTIGSKLWNKFGSPSPASNVSPQGFDTGV